MRSLETSLSYQDASPDPRASYANAVDGQRGKQPLLPALNKSILSASAAASQDRRQPRGRNNEEGVERRSQNILSKSLMVQRGVSSSPKNLSELGYRDFMPRDAKGMPVDDGKPGAYRFLCNLGSCYDKHIDEELLYHVPKHKSYIKQSDLRVIPQMTPEEEAQQYRLQKEKGAIDIMYDQCMREMRYLEKNVGRWAREETAKKSGLPPRLNHPSVAEARGLKQADADEVPACITGGNKQKGIKTSTVFRTQAQEDAIRQLMREANEAEKLREIAKNAR